MLIILLLVAVVAVEHQLVLVVAGGGGGAGGLRTSHLVVVPSLAEQGLHLTVSVAGCNYIYNISARCWLVVLLWNHQDQ